MKILVVEDNEQILELIETYLVVQNFLVDRATDGQAAVEMAKQKKYDVIVLDIMLPKQNGFSVISSLRALGKEVPILAISADSQVKSRIQALDLGADDFLVKDFSFEELVSRIKALQRRKVQHQSNIFKAADLILDYTNMRATYRQKTLELTQKEFAILLKLIQNKNQLVGREELINSIWNKDNRNMYSNTVDVHMRSLRQKLGAAKDLIKTIRGQGYVLEAT